jgi:hypothetical protein
MQRLNRRIPGRSSGISEGGNWSFTPGGSTCWHALSAALNRAGVTPSCCAVGDFALLAPGCGSGKFGTPCARIQRENARSFASCGGLGVELPHATAGTANAASAATINATHRTGGSDNRCAAPIGLVRVLIISSFG